MQAQLSTINSHNTSKSTFNTLPFLYAIRFLHKVKYVRCGGHFRWVCPITRTGTLSQCCMLHENAYKTFEFVLDRY